MNDPLNLEAVYYASPIPANAAVLTMMGLVFDKVWFPGVAIPTQNYDPAEVTKEISRLESLNSRMASTHELIAMLRFMEHAKTLEGFCIFPGTGDISENSKIPQKMVGDLYEAIHGPNPPGWHPAFETAHYKGIPGSEETLIYRGAYHYLAGAVLEASETARPLIVDRPGLPVPGLDGASPKDDATALSALLAIHCTALVLPKVTVLPPVQLMEFRAENEKTLRTFRRAMLRYAGELNSEISGLAPHELEGKTDFFVKTRILPELDELREAVAASIRTWSSRFKDGMQIVGDVIPACFSVSPKSAILMALMKNAPGFIGREVAAAGDKAAKHRRSDLYYLLSIEKATR